MARCVIKPNPDVDEYLVWSTVVDCYISQPLSKEKLLEYAQLKPSFSFIDEACIARADETGASWQEWRQNVFGTEVVIREVRVGTVTLAGTCQFGDIPEIYRAHRAKNLDRLSELIQPYEDDR